MANKYPTPFPIDAKSRSAMEAAGYVFWSDEDRAELLAQLLARSRVNGNCLEWIGAQNGRGYAQITFRKGRTRIRMRVHRAAFAAEHGFMPPSHREVCHECDNRICIKPKHLWEGSHADNMADMVGKGRSGKGRKHPPEFGRQITERQTGQKRPDGFGAKMSAIQIGKKLTAEHIANSAAARRGMKQTDQHKANSSKAQKLRRQRERELRNGAPGPDALKRQH